MAEHPAFTLAGLLAGGGTFGFYRTRSKPSLIAGLTLGASFACAGPAPPPRPVLLPRVAWILPLTYSTLSIGYLLKKNKDYGAELALGSSVLLLGAGAQRMIATQAKSPPAIGLSVAGALSTYYYQKKFREFRFGV
ncbi:putative transmembrane protein 14C [Colletotrichum sublineola]|uniref:Putative transmembrane protein 14C n=1 Tax=Colletotrichum sublineola TaxID=1173701 RepID=A0A066WVF9_COLSU|nr:putative transmembrane protein 14C [Colletotrichum sublineola]